MAPNNEADDLAAAIAQVYGGDPGDFVKRRDAFARELRQAGQRAEASIVKGLRKPTRPAWALDVAALHRPERVERVVAAVADTLVAQSGGGDVRAALAALREAVEAFAAAAHHAAASAGYSVDHAELANAVMAIIGSTDAFDALRAGRLADVPEGGGIAPLSGALPGEAAAAGVTDLGARGAGAVTGGAAPAGRGDGRGGASQKHAAEEERRRARTALAAARERSASAQRALRAAEAALERAEAALARAQQDLVARQVERERVHEEAGVAATALAEAERAIAELHAASEDEPPGAGT